MALADVFDCFVKQSPFVVMTRAALENVFSPGRLDAIFERTSSRQRSGDLLFSTVADLMGTVVTNVHPSVNAAYRAKAEEIGVTVKAVYDKLKGVEPNVCRTLVRETAGHMAAIIEKTGGKAADLLPGYRVKILDGNHLRRTDRRIAALREGNVAPLPGKSLVVLDPALRLAIDVIPCEDGHAQERSLLPELAETIEQSDVWFADRNFCTTRFLSAFFAAKSHFVIRQHAQTTLSWELEGRRKKVGDIETGVVYEQTMRMVDADEKHQQIRRVTVKLDEPTRDGDDEIHVLTNLPRKVNARRIAELYRKRWTIETAFQEMAENLQGEINTLGYPKAALFGFCMALVSYNVLSVTKAAVFAAHGEEAETLSTYYVADEIAATYRGMMIVLAASYWTKRFGHLTPAKMARTLVEMAQDIDLKRYRKNPWTPKQRKTHQGRLPPRKHVSTQRVLQKQYLASTSYKTGK